MAKILNIVEFLSKIKKDVMPNDDKKFGKSEFSTKDFRYKIDFFNTGHGISYCEYEYECRDDVTLYMQEENGYSFICFNDATSVSEFGGINKKFYLRPNEFWIGKMNAKFDGTNHYAANKIYRNKAIMISNELQNELEIFTKISQKDENFAYEAAMINAGQRQILNELENAKNYTGKLKEIFLEAKILELICQSTHCQCERCKNGDTKYLTKARSIILSDLQNPPSIKELAHLCATNEFKLKKEFKAHYGTTIYAMLQDERLKVANELLINGDISVNEAAKMVGYKNLSHFAKIFKAKFELLPTQVVRAKSYYFMDGLKA